MSTKQRTKNSKRGSSPGKSRRKRLDLTASHSHSRSPVSKTELPSDMAQTYAMGSLSKALRQTGSHVVLVGDIVSGFNAYGPFSSGEAAIRWRMSAGVRELTQGNWYLMQLLAPVTTGETFKEDP